jgi:DNA-binding NarL/FixJ family response regulator
VCRALKVLCVAADPMALAELKRASVSMEWELVGGATDEAEALRQLHEERPHVVVVFGPFERFVALALEAYPALRVVADRDLAGASAVVLSAAEVRAEVLGRSRPGGSIGSGRPGGSDG